MNKPHLDKVDFLRGIAILLVFVYHSQLVLFPGYEVHEYNEYNWLKLNGTSSVILNFSPSAFGFCGVQLFLIISGFLIHLGYLINKNKFHLGTFYSKRFWRIYPPYILVLLFIIFSTGNFPNHLLTWAGFKDTIFHVFFLHNLSDATFFTINPAFWSLALEVQLYLVYPLLLFARNKIGIGKVFLATILLSVILLIFGILNPKIGTTNAFGTSVFKFWFIWTSGAYLAESYLTKKRIFNSNGAIISIAFLLLGMISRLHLYSQHFTVYFLTFGLIGMFECVINNDTLNTKGILVRFVSLIGICSYSMYLIHQPYLNELFNFFPILKAEKWKYYILPFKIIPVFLIIFLISYSLYVFVEKPSTYFGQKLRDQLKIKRSSN